MSIRPAWCSHLAASDLVSGGREVCCDLVIDLMDMLIFVACLHTRDASLAHSQGERRSFSMVDIRQGPRVKLTVLCVVTVVGEGQAKGFLEIVSTKLMVLYSPADIIIIVGIK